METRRLPVRFPAGKTCNCLRKL